MANSGAWPGDPYKYSPNTRKRAGHTFEAIMAAYRNEHPDHDEALQTYVRHAFRPLMDEAVKAFLD